MLTCHTCSGQIEEPDDDNTTSSLTLIVRDLVGRSSGRMWIVLAGVANFAISLTKTVVIQKEKKYMKNETCVRLLHV